MDYEIILANQLEDEMKVISHFNASFIPQEGDLIPLNGENYEIAFKVEHRILPESNNKKIVLLGHRVPMNVNYFKY